MKSPDQVDRPGIRVIDMDERRQLVYFDLCTLGKDLEPELMDFEGDTLYYMDIAGHTYKVAFLQE